jgi:sigma-B regulation protein RsbU (phosphoserine phosphatase)
MLSASPFAQVLVVDAAPTRTRGLLDGLRVRGFPSTRIDLAEPVDPPAVRKADAAIVVLEGHYAEAHERELVMMLDRLNAAGVATLVWGQALPPGLSCGALIEHVQSEASSAEVIGRLVSTARYAPLVKRMERELRHLQRLGEQLNGYFGQIDRDMRLAGRLQRDFMGQAIPEAPPLRFATLFRPASWVSGDIFDIFRVDEQHVGVFLADAMGHGTAAALLTVFLRQALVPRRLREARWEVVSPADVMRGLHEAVARQQLATHHYVTAVYGVINCRTLELRLARGAHPYPLLVSRQGAIRELRPEGDLIGLPDVEPEFQPETVPLEPGDKLIFYTDGIDEAVIHDRDATTRQATFTETFMAWSRLPAAELAAAVEAHLDAREGSLHPADDVSLVVVEVASRP